MITVSKAFEDNIYKSIREKVRALITFKMFDKTAYLDDTSTVTSEAPLSRKNQLTDKERAMSYKYATFEPNYFKLDGSFRIPPKPNEGDFEVGWWSEILSDADGIFTPSQDIEFSFSEAHSSAGITITFDPKTNEYASDFSIDVYTLGDILIYSENVINNTKVSYIMDKGVEDYGKVVITITKWINPFRRARIVEVDFGVIITYGIDKIIKANIIEQLDVISDTIPSNELVFTIDNMDKSFNILNPKGFHKYLKETQEVDISFGLDIGNETYEDIPMGVFYLTDWKSDEGAMTTTFTARDIFEILEQKMYEGSFAGTLYDLAEEVLIAAGVEEYQIDIALQSISTNGFTKALSARKALQYIGVAGKAVVYQDRYGVLVIKRLTLLNDSTSYMVFSGDSTFCGFTTIQTDSHLSMRQITLDNMMQVPQIKLDKLVKSITVTVYGAIQEDIIVYNSGVNEGLALKHENPLITTEESAQSIAKWILDESNLRAIYAVKWRQNPALTCGDIVIVEDAYNEQKQSRIRKQEFEYQGYLRGNMETKGGV